MSQEVFYPINSPLINYFFYKAPFVTNAYVLTGFDINNAGTGYAVKDVIVTAGGTYTSPAVFQVTGVSGGAITSAVITNDGKYTVTPSSFTQAATNGSGTGATFNNLVFTANILPNGVNVPLAGGFLFFYADEDHTLQLPTYSDVSDPNNPVVNTNPIQLGASGECPLFYLQNRLYYIVITDYTGDQADPVHTVEHYNPADQQVISSFNNNFIANPQFNYPIEFWKSTDDVGEVSQPSTFVAWGCEFLEDEDTDTENIITFNPVSGLEIEGHPINELVLDSDTVSSAETLKDFRWTIGAVDINAEGNMTFSAQMISKTGSPIPTVLKIERFFGEGGSPTEIITITTFSVTSTRQKFTFSFILPTIIGKVIGDGNYLAVRLVPGLKTVCTFGITNVLVMPGNVANPVFVDEAQAFTKSQILGVSTDISEAGLPQNYSPYYYTDGTIFPLPDTGTIVLEPNTTKQVFREKCDGSSRKVKDYSPNDIPYKRLYDVIGNTFGGSGELIASADEDTVTVSSAAGARPKSAWSAGTTSFTVTNTVLGLRVGIKFVDNGNLTVSGTFSDKFTPSQTPPPLDTASPGAGAFHRGTAAVMNYWGTVGGAINAANIGIVTTDPGSPTVNSTFTMTFTDLNPNEYKTRTVSVSGGPVISSFLECSTFSNNSRTTVPGNFSVNQMIIFSLDGVYDGLPGFPGFQSIAFANSFVVPFKSVDSIQQNVKTFVDYLSNPFVFTIKINSPPLASQYLLISSETTDFYPWFTVDGVGTDPMIPSRTGIQVDTFTGQTVEQIAVLLAEAIDNLEFSLPAPADLPALVGSSKVSWYINL